MDNSQRRFLILICIALLIVCLPCQGRSQWIEMKGADFAVFYQAGYEKDAEFTKKWMDQIQHLMKTKYGAKPDNYNVSVYLFPAPAGTIDINQSGENTCCSKTGSGKQTGTINLLTMSAAVWKQHLRSSLGLDKSGEDYQAKVLVSEYIPIGHYAVQDARPSGGWAYYDAPNWFVQGLQEYDAIFHSTDFNRSTTSQRLFDWATHNRSKFTCCAPKLDLADDYNGGAAFLAFLADKFGEDIHVRILRNSSPSFESALLSETKAHSLSELFGLFEKWLDQKQH